MNEGNTVTRHSSPAAPCELRQGRYGLFTVRLNLLDLGAIQAHLSDQVASAPGLLENAPVVLDPSALPELPAADQAEDLLARLRAAGLQPLALAHAPDADRDYLAQLFRLPLVAAEPHRRLAKVEDPEPAQTDAESVAADAADAISVEPAAPVLEPEHSAPLPAAAAPAVAPIGGSLYVNSPVRSGQQVYAKGRDLVVTAAVSAGAELIADGCIHVYGRLAGKALAGARGDEKARIYCLNFQPELVSIAGQYRLIESIPAEMRGQAVEVLLDNERLDIRALGTR